MTADATDFARVKSILQNTVSLSALPDSLVGETDLYNLGLSSFDLVNLLVAIESAFAVEFPDAMMQRTTFRTINAICAAIATLRQEQCIE